MDNESDVQPRPEFEVRKTVFPDEPEGREPESPTEETNGTNGGLHEEAAPSEDAVEPGKIWQLKANLSCPLNTKIEVRPVPENTRLLFKGKYHSTADLLFDWFGFNQTSRYFTNSA